MKKLCILALSLIVLLSSFGLAAFAETTTTDVATVKSLDEFNAAIGDENINTIILGDNIILTYRYEVANFNKADRHITIDGQNLYGFVGNNENWRTDTYKHLYNINKGNITFKDLTFDCNNQGQGVNVYQAKNVTLDNVKIINVNTRAFTSLTVNRSIVSVINGIYIRGVAQAIDVDKNDNGLALNLSGVIDVDNKTIRWSAGSPAESDVSGALQTDGVTPYFPVASVDKNGNVLKFHTSFSVSEMTRQSSQAKLLADYTLSQDVILPAVNKTFDLDLNGKTLTVADGYALKSAGVLTIHNGTVNGVVEPYADGFVSTYAATANYSFDESITTPTVIADSNITVNVPQGCYQAITDDNQTITSYSLAIVDGTNYNNLRDAIRAAINTGKELSLTADITLKSVVNINAGESLAIDLNGHTLSAALADSSAYPYMMMNMGTLTINDSTGDGEIIYTNNDVSGKMYATIVNMENARMTVNGGTIKNGAQAGGDDSAIYNSGALEITDGAILAANADALVNEDVASAEITGGVFSSRVANGIAEGYHQVRIDGLYHVLEMRPDTIMVTFEETNAKEGEKQYDIVLKCADEHIMNRLNTADLTFLFANTPSTTNHPDGAMTYEITPADDIDLTTDRDLPNRYLFSFKHKNTGVADTGTSLKIGEVVFRGYGTFSFSVNENASGKNVNIVNLTELSNNIVDTFVINGDTANGEGNLDVSNKLTDIKIEVPTSTLDITVAFPNAVDNRVPDFQNMKVTISGGDLMEDIVVNLGYGATFSGTSDDDDTVTFDNQKRAYNIILKKELTKNYSYNVTVEGAGYRTARYTVNMATDKKLNFWNNVMDKEEWVEKDEYKTATNFLAGDILADNHINIYDLSAVVSHFAEKTSNDHAAWEYVQYDLNRDGVIDSKDVAYVLVSWNK